MAKVKYSFRGGEPIGYSAPNRRGKGGCVLLVLLCLAAGAIVWYFMSGIGVGKTMPPAEPVKKQAEEVPVTPKVDKAAKTVKTETDKTVKKADVKVPQVIQALSGKKLEQYQTITAQAENNFKKENYWKAREDAQKALKLVPENSDLWIKSAKLLSDVNTKLLNTDVPCPKKVLYTIEPGDILQKIARKHNTTMEQVLLSNKMPQDKYRLWAGNTLKIYHGDWKLKINKKLHRLYLYDGDELFKVFNIGIGKQDRTPVGTFKVAARIKEPDWYAPNGQVYAFGAKENVLGTRWLALKPTGETNSHLKGYGIHGTWDRDSIGKDRSNGCIRMLNEQVEEVFRIVPLGTPVEIVEK